MLLELPESVHAFDASFHFVDDVLMVRLSEFGDDEAEQWIKTQFQLTEEECAIGPCLNFTLEQFQEFLSWTNR